MKSFKKMVGGGGSKKAKEEEKQKAAEEAEAAKQKEEDEAKQRQEQVRLLAEKAQKIAEKAQKEADEQAAEAAAEEARRRRQEEEEDAAAAIAAAEEEVAGVNLGPEYIILLGVDDNKKQQVAATVCSFLSIPEISFRMAQDGEEEDLEGETVDEALEKLGLLEQRFAQPDCKKGFLLTDFPQRADMCEELDDLVARSFPGSSAEGDEAGITRCIELFVPPTTEAISKKYDKMIVPIANAYQSVHKRIDATRTMAQVNKAVLSIFEEDLGLSDDSDGGSKSRSGSKSSKTGSQSHSSYNSARGPKGSKDEVSNKSSTERGAAGATSSSVVVSKVVTGVSVISGVENDDYSLSPLSSPDNNNNNSTLVKIKKTLNIDIEDAAKNVVQKEKKPRAFGSPKSSPTAVGVAGAGAGGPKASPDHSMSPKNRPGTFTQVKNMQDVSASDAENGEKGSRQWQKVETEESLNDGDLMDVVQQFRTNAVRDKISKEEGDG